ncbi:DNA cytosine methyltransferase [Polaribacter sejongensis]|uniref:DNA cytosine methyltransferase n=1 Tax=Polaribacter sejongensis TaxID=985043 RepID=UPI0035A6D47C
MIGIEIFSGPGGMGLGAKYAGIDVALAVEKNAYAAQTYLANHSDTTVVVDDIQNINEFRYEKKENRQSFLVDHLAKVILSLIEKQDQTKTQRIGCF